MDTVSFKPSSSPVGQHVIGVNRVNRGVIGMPFSHGVVEVT